MSKYRVCKNKYDWWKIQVEESIFIYKSKKHEWIGVIIDLFAVILSPLTLIILGIDIIFDLSILHNYETYFKRENKVWEDHFSQELYETKEMALKKIDEYVENDRIIEEKANNDWECQGEI